MVLALVLLAAPRPALAQAATISHSCATAELAVVRGHPAKGQDDAYRTLQSCPSESARLFAGLFIQLRGSNDTSAFRWLVHHATYWRDGDIFASALTVAGDSGATALARAYSLVALDRLFDRGDYHPVLHAGPRLHDSAIRTAGCHVVSESDETQMVGVRPLPDDALDRLKALARRLADDESAPPLVRRTAACMR